MFIVEGPTEDRRHAEDTSVTDIMADASMIDAVTDESVTRMSGTDVITDVTGNFSRVQIAEGPGASNVLIDREGI